MKKNLRLLTLPLFVCLFSCNESTSTKEKTVSTKITELPVTAKSTEAIASFQQGITELDLGDVKNARMSFTKAIEQDPGMGIAYLYRANTSTSSKEFADDIKAGKLKVDSASNWEKLYADYLSTNLSGDRTKGIEVLQKMATAYPDAARAQTELGNGYAGNNQFDKARELYQKAIQLNPT